VTEPSSRKAFDIKRDHNYALPEPLVLSRTIKQLLAKNESLVKDLKSAKRNISFKQKNIQNMKAALKKMKTSDLVTHVPLPYRNYRNKIMKIIIFRVKMVKTIYRACSLQYLKRCLKDSGTKK